MRPKRSRIEAVPATGTPTKKHRSPSDRRRDAERIQKRIEQRLAERHDAWASGQGRDEFTVIRQDGAPGHEGGPDAYLHQETPGSLAGLHVERRAVLAKDADGRDI